MAKRKVLYLHVSDDVEQLFAKCQAHIESVKRDAGLDPTTSVSEVLRQALIAFNEKFEAGTKRPPRKAM
jgi:hypothetical protein